MVKKFTNEDVFIENSYYARHHIKRRVIEQNLIPYKCGSCSNEGSYNNKPLSLQLDHINGISEDHRITNLRFLCPNCHSQTETYAGKSTAGKRIYNKRSKLTKYSVKLESDKLLWQELKNDKELRLGEWGWKTRLCKRLNITSQKVGPWLRRVDPDFLSV